MATKKKPAIIAQIPIPTGSTARREFSFRGHNVMLDADLAELYQVETKTLIKAVKRNLERFPEDFMFQLTEEEWEALRSQIGISNKGLGGRRSAPYVLTEEGVAALSTVLNSDRAIQVNIAIIRAIVQANRFPTTLKELVDKISAMEKAPLLARKRRIGSRSRRTKQNSNESHWSRMCS